jgi:hypothetical protein
MNLSNDYSMLEQYVQSLRAKFLSPYIPANPAHVPATYRDDVTAFCVLLHAALEEYFEDVAKLSITVAVDDWLNSGRKTESLIAICLNLADKISIPSDGNFPRPIQQLMREKLIAARKNFIDALEANHGVSKHYLAKILGRIGIGIDSDAVFESSLAKIVEHRGEFAHKRPKKNLAPEDAEKYATDCLLYCLDVSSKAQEALV